MERALAYHIRASLEIYLAAHVTQGQRVVVVASHHLRVCAGWSRREGGRQGEKEAGKEEEPGSEGEFRYCVPVCVSSVS